MKSYIFLWVATLIQAVFGIYNAAMTRRIRRLNREAEDIMRHAEEVRENGYLLAFREGVINGRTAALSRIIKPPKDEVVFDSTRDVQGFPLVHRRIKVNDEMGQDVSQR